jgi:Ulp1 family protease
LPTGYAVDPKDFFNNLKMKKNCVKETRNTLTNAQRILWPMSDGSHWYLVIIDKLANGKFNLFCLDSLNSDNEEYLEKAKSLLQNLYPDQAIDDLIHKQEFIQVPTQNNWVDCGVAVCYYAKLCTNKLLPRNKAGSCDNSQFRFNIAEEFAKNMTLVPHGSSTSSRKRHGKFQQ